jgi:hypothetical protein
MYLDGLVSNGPHLNPSNLQDDMETVPWSDVVRKIMAAQKRLRCCPVCIFPALTLLFQRKSKTWPLWRVIP